MSKKIFWCKNCLNMSTRPIIAGGAGNEKHLIEGILLKSVSAVATANLFNFIGNGLPNARKKIIEEKFILLSRKYD